MIPDTNQKLVPAKPGLFLDLPAVFTRTSFRFVSPPSYEDGTTTLIRLAEVDDADNYWTGDCLCQLEEFLGDKFSQAVADAHIAEDKAMILMHVSRRVDPKVRRIAPSWSHAREAAGLDELQQMNWLTDAKANGW